MAMLQHPPRIVRATEEAYPIQSVKQSTMHWDLPYLIALRLTLCWSVHGGQKATTLSDSYNDRDLNATTGLSHARV